MMELKLPCFVFYLDGIGEIGKLTWEKGVLEFTGEAEESARVFFDILRPYIDQYIQSEKG